MSKCLDRFHNMRQPTGGYLNPKSMVVTQYNNHGGNSTKNGMSNFFSRDYYIFAMQLMTRIDFEEMIIELLARTTETVPKQWLGDATQSVHQIYGTDDSSLYYLYRVFYQIEFFSSKNKEVNTPSFKYIEPVTFEIFKQTILPDVQNILNNWRDFLNIHPILKAFHHAITEPTTNEAVSVDLIAPPYILSLSFSKGIPTKWQTSLPVLWYLCCLHQENYQNLIRGVQSVGVYNPRTNTLYSVRLDSINKEMFQSTQIEALGYSLSEVISFGKIMAWTQNGPALVSNDVQENTKPSPTKVSKNDVDTISENLSVKQSSQNTKRTLIGSDYFHTGSFDDDDPLVDKIQNIKKKMGNVGQYRIKKKHFKDKPIGKMAASQAARTTGNAMLKKVKSIVLYILFLLLLILIAQFVIQLYLTSGHKLDLSVFEQVKDFLSLR